MKMSIMFRIAQSFILFFVYLENVNSNTFVLGETYSSSLLKCTAVCEKTFPLTSNKIAGSECCSRGCRFYGIAELVTANKQTELNISKEACHNYCYESYNEHYDRAACNLGCDSMAKHHRKMLQTIGYRIAEESWSVLIEDGEGSQFLHTGETSEPDDVLTDPGLRRQLLLDLILLGGDRLPAMRVKTLPVDDDSNDRVGGGGVRWWSECGRRQAGAPRCLFASLLVLLILLALWFGLSREERAAPPSPPIRYDCAPPLPPKYSLLDDQKA